MPDNRINPIRARAMDRLQWVDPKIVLTGLRQIELAIPPNTEAKVRHLRTHGLKQWREARQALLVAWGLSQTVIGKDVLVARDEEMDYDCILRWRDDDRQIFYPIQLKELPPEDLNPKVTLNDIFDGLEKYDGESDLSVAVHINREMRLNYAPWSRPNRPRIRELWLFGGISADQNEWFLYGNMLRDDSQFRRFQYPSMATDDA